MTVNDDITRYDIVFAADEKFAGIMNVAICSLLDNNRDLCGIHIYILDDGISERTRTRIISSLDSYNVDVSFVNVQKYMSALSKEGIEGYHGNYTVYARLLIPELLGNEVKKVIYLDCDILVIRSLRELFQTDIQNKTIAGVLDPSRDDCIKRLPQLSSDDIYINSGVLVIDCERWRNNKYTDKIKQLLVSDRCTFLLPDQDIINIVFQDDIHVLDLKYNLFYWIKGINSSTILYSERLKLINAEKWYDRNEYRTACRDTVIIHFVRIQLCEPWNKGNYGHALWHKYSEKISPVNAAEYKKQNDHEGRRWRLLKKFSTRIYLAMRKYKKII